MKEIDLHTWVECQYKYAKHKMKVKFSNPERLCDLNDVFCSISQYNSSKGKQMIKVFYYKSATLGSFIMTVLYLAEY